MATIDPPRTRECDRCGRQEIWDDDRGTWVAARGDGTASGEPHCVHEWDITGSYHPLADGHRN